MHTIIIVVSVNIIGGSVVLVTIMTISLPSVSTECFKNYIYMTMINMMIISIIINIITTKNVFYVIKILSFTSEGSWQGIPHALQHGLDIIVLNFTL